MNGRLLAHGACRHVMQWGDRAISSSAYRVGPADGGC